jgi:PHD/YefM family antitoxin component YafN of YafNO toxin-antitoxin module
VKTLPIRELNAPALAAAAESEEVIVITNDSQPAGVLVPVSPWRVGELIELHLSRIKQSVDRGEAELKTAIGQGTVRNLDTLHELRDGDNFNQESQTRSTSSLKRIPLREVRGSVLREAAEKNEAFLVTSDRVVAGIVYPIGSKWVSQLVDQNISRVLKNLDAGEAELRDMGSALAALD